MSSKSKDFRKNIKGPDQFQNQVVSGFDQMYKYRIMLGSVVAVVLVIAAGFIGRDYYQSTALEERIETLGGIHEAYQAETKKLDTEKLSVGAEIATLKKPGKKDKPGKPKKLSAADKKKVAALEKKRDDLKEDHSASQQQYLDFYKQNVVSPEGWMAGMSVVSGYVGEKKFSEAKAIIAEVLKQSKGNLFYQVQARFVYINVLVELKEFDTALAEVDVLGKIASEDEMKPKLMLLKGRILLSKNAREDAQKIFDSLINDHPTTPEAQTARSMKALLLN